MLLLLTLKCNFCDQDQSHTLFLFFYTEWCIKEEILLTCCCYFDFETQLLWSRLESYLVVSLFFYIEWCIKVEMLLVLTLKHNFCGQDQSHTLLFLFFFYTKWCNKEEMLLLLTLKRNFCGQDQSHTLLFPFFSIQNDVLR